MNIKPDPRDKAKSAIPPQSNSIFTVRRILLLILCTALFSVIAGGAWFYISARGALPQLDGEITAADLKKPVTVTRDAHGVPHIQASDVDDLFLVQGFVTAQDRLWQMDMLRRYAAGELSEIVGTETIAHDRTQRILGLRQATRRAFAALPDRERIYLEDYARGVNASMVAQRNHLPMEFRLMRYQPRSWEPEETLLISAFMCQLLNHYTFEFELGRERAQTKLGADLAGDLYTDSARGVIVPGAASADLTASLLQPVAAIEPLLPGSNNWAVSGVHTLSGKPLLSNDMHLPHQMPNLWYEAHLQAGDFNVAGLTLPGAPFVIVGHNARIAWGFTNLGPDVEDIYVEEFNDRGEYRVPSGWMSPRHRREVIKVKGAKDVNIEVLETRHGPIVSDLVPNESRKLSLRWTLYDPAALAIPFFYVNTAKNWEEFRSAFARFGAPGQNVVYADVDGHIGYQATGFIPIRASGTGVTPVYGGDDAHEWIGYVPFDKLPSVRDPASGILATANARITPDDYPYVLGKQWDAPYRTHRIYDVLKSGKKLGVEDMLRLQTDIYSDYDRRFAQRFADAVGHSKTATSRAGEAADLLRGWDGEMSLDAAAPSIEIAARKELVRLLLEPKLGKDYENYHWFMAPVWLENTVLTRSPRWLPAGYADYDALLLAALQLALSQGSAPGNLRSWRWGSNSSALIEHPIYRKIPFLANWSAPGRFEQSGDSYTVKQVGSFFGPSERLTVDFSDFDKTTLNTVTGQAGNILSPYYMDQWHAWYEGFTFPFPFSAAAVEKAQSHRLVLRPSIAVNPIELHSK